MANFSASCQAIEGGDVPDEILLSPFNSSSNRYPIAQGDTLTFTVNGSYSITFGNVNTTYLTCNRSLPATVSPGQTIVFTNVWTGADTTYNIALSASSGPMNAFETAYLDLLQALDETPSNWTFPNLTADRPGEYLYFTKQVNDINTEITVSVSGGIEIGVKNNSYDTSYSGSVAADDGETKHFRCKAPADYNQSTTYTIVGGTESDSFNVTTGAAPDPNTGAKVPSGLTLPISQDAVGAFFGTTGSSDTVLSNYVRGGDYVPNITENSGIPLSVPINLSDFVGAHTAIYFRIPPVYKQDAKNTLSGAQSIVLQWLLDTDYEMGFGIISNALEYRITLQNYSKSGAHAGVEPDATLNVTSTSFHPNNGNFSVSATCGINHEVIHYGDLLIEARSPSYPSAVVSYTVGFSMDFVGP